MSRKSETLTPRQRQSQQIMRDKTAKKRRDNLRRKMQFIGGAVMGVVFVGGGSLFYYSGALSRTSQTIMNTAYQSTVKAGFSVASLHIEGRNRTPMNVVMEALAVKKGDPILQLSLAEMRDRLKAVHSVSDAAVERVLPNGLYVRIIEREPVALWQYEGSVSLVDDQGIVMTGIDVVPYKNLPLIVGEGAPQHVMELIKMLQSTPDIAKEFASAIRVGDRRWNVRLKDGIELKLPEENASEALVRLAEMSAKQQLLKRDVMVIDLRLPDRIFIKTTPAQPEAPVVNAKET